MKLLTPLLFIMVIMDLMTYTNIPAAQDRRYIHFHLILDVMLILAVALACRKEKGKSGLPLDFDETKQVECPECVKYLEANPNMAGAEVGSDWVSNGCSLCGGSGAVDPETAAKFVSEHSP